MDILLKYFPHLSLVQQDRFAELQALYEDWNSKINVISRKDIEQLYVNHVLHSLGIAKVLTFNPQATVLDVGTGGGFPGIPLAIMFPETQFYLIDSIGKKIKVVNEVATQLGLDNVIAEHKRAQDVTKKFDFVVSRAVTQMPEFVLWVQGRLKTQNKHELPNGILYLKGGDLTEELYLYPQAVEYLLKNFFEEEFFETKKVVYLPM